MVLFLPQAEFMGWWSRVKLAETPHTSDLLETVLHSVPAAVGCAALEVLLSKGGLFPPWDTEMILWKLKPKRHPAT